MSKDVITIKKLLKMDLFQPYNCSFWEVSRRHNTEIVIMLADLDRSRINELVEKCNKTDIGSCYFKSGDLILFLLYLAPDRFNLGFIPSNAKQRGRPSTQEYHEFLHFLGGKNE